MLGSLPVPTKVPHRYLSGRLVHVEAEGRSHTGHRAPLQRVGQGLGQLALEGVQDLGANDAGWVGGGEGHQ